MRISRIYQDTELKPGTELMLDKKASHYVATVLRLESGHAIKLFNGDGFNYPAEIRSANKRTVTVFIHDVEANDTESTIYTHLGQVLTRGEKMDWIIQKSVELGVNEITPLFSERCGVKLPKERLVKKLEHWRSIIISACEQSGRSIIPTINSPQQIEQWCQSDENFLAVLCSFDETNFTLSSDTTQIKILVGPEGGLTDQEINSTQLNKFKNLNLGKRILRAETAALTSQAVLQHLATLYVR